MRVLIERDQIADSKMARTGLEYVTKGQSAQNRVTARAAARDRQAIGIYQSFLGQKPRAVYAIVNIYHTPVAFQTLAIITPVTCAAAVIHVQHSDAATRPILDC